MTCWCNVRKKTKNEYTCNSYVRMDNNNLMQEWTGTTVYTFFSEMSFPRIDRLVHSVGALLLIQRISDACVSSTQNDKQIFLHEVELSEESEKKRKVAAQRRVARVVLRVKKDMWWRMGTWWLWKAELARISLRELARSLGTILPLVCQNHLLSGVWHLPS